MDEEKVSEVIAIVLKSGHTIVGRMSFIDYPVPPVGNDILRFVKLGPSNWFAGVLQIVLAQSRDASRISYNFAPLAQFGNINDPIEIWSEEVSFCYYANKETVDNYEQALLQLKAKAAGIVTPGGNKPPLKIIH